MRGWLQVSVTVAVIVGAGLPVLAQRDNDFGNDDERVTAEIDRGIQQAMIEAQQAIKAEQYVPAVTRLQSVLDHSEDYFIRKDFRVKGQEIPGVKAQTHRILAQLPPKGRTVYEMQYGPTARALLNEAMQTGDLTLIGDVVARFQTTAAGNEAMQVLIAAAFDHDRLIEAGLLCEQAAGSLPYDKLQSGRLLLRAAYAWHLAGQTERSQTNLDALRELNIPELWRLGGRNVSPWETNQNGRAWLNEQFGSPLPWPMVTVRDWLMPRGGVTGNESATSAYPIGDGDWTISPLQYARIHFDERLNESHRLEFDKLAREVETLLSEDNRLTQPASVPIIVGNTVVFRTLNDITAVSLRSGQLLWRSSITDGMLSWLLQSPTANLDSIASSSPITFKGYLRHKLFRDQLSNSLTSDGSSLYAIEESESQFNVLRPRIRQPIGTPFYAEPANKLVAYDVQGGRIRWEVGGLRGTPPADLSGLFFLGPPLPLEGRLYCLAEVKSELCLLCLVQQVDGAALEWSQTLISMNDARMVGALRRFQGVAPVVGSPRRIAGLTPVFSNGMLVCSTASGSVIGFDVHLRQLRWGHSYEVSRGRNVQEGYEFIAPFQVDEEEGRWIDGGAIIADGRVIVTPRDSAELLCLNLADGSLVWKRPREQGLYVAMVDEGRVIVVGRSQIMAYSLADGAEAWPEALQIPEPAGRGVREGSRYLLPLSTGEIATLDVKSGRILGRSRLSGARMPGNLAVADGALVSSGIHEVIAFRSISAIEEQIQQSLAQRPSDPDALAMRGELRLHQGDTTAAIEDLRASLQQLPQPRVKQVLAETLLGVLKNDPAKLLSSANELEALAEEPQQRVQFLYLYAKALNAAGSRVAAVRQLFRLAEVLGDRENLIQVEPGHSIAMRQSIRSQLFRIETQANSDERSQIARVFTDQFDTCVHRSDNGKSIMEFAQLTVGHPAADPLLQHLIQSDSVELDVVTRRELLERLTNSADRSIQGFAVAQLAAQGIEDHLPTTSLPWIRLLKEKFADQVCRDGKTGRELSDQWLGQDDVRAAIVAPAVWPTGEVTVEQPRRKVPLSAFPVEVVTQVGSQFTDWTFELDHSAGSLVARDPSLHIAWQLPLQEFSDMPRVQAAQLHIRGRHLVFSAGMSLFVLKSIDPSIVPAVVFNRSLRSNSLIDRRSTLIQVERRLLPNGRRFQVAFDIRGSAGFLVGLSDEAVIYQLDNRLIAASLEDGQILWSRAGAEFSKSSGTVDETLVLHTTTNEVILLNPMDGNVIARQKTPLDETPVWFHGTRRLTQRVEGREQVLIEMREFNPQEKSLWQQVFPPATLLSVVANEAIAVLEPSGQLTMLSLETGNPLIKSRTPIVRPAEPGGGVLAVQKYGDAYLVVGGVGSRKTDLRTVTNLEIGPPTDTTFTIDGAVCSINPADGTVNWSVPVEQTAFDSTQPAKYPILVLAARHSEFDPLGQFARMPRLSTLVLDKRNGNKIFETQESLSAINRSPQLIPLIDEHKLIVDYQVRNLELTLTDHPPGEQK